MASILLNGQQCMVGREHTANLVELARQGRQDAKDRLAREAAVRLRAYIYRVTLDHEVAEDLAQESMLEMLRSLTSLTSVEHFWSWVYGITHRKIQQYYRDRQRKAAISASVFYKDFLAHHPDPRSDDGLRRLLREELSRTVMTAMKQLKQEYRAVLSLRCYDRLSYEDIAVALDCSKLTARVLFYRAKQALKRQLMRQGVSGSLLTMCLGMFGKLTAPPEAEHVAVTAASTKAGLTAAVVSTAGSKAGIATITAAVALLATFKGYRLVSSGTPLPKREQVRSIHYIQQSRSAAAGRLSSLSKGAYEQWYYFPEGVDGPMFTRMQRWDPLMTRKLCSWLQNDQANYYYHAGEGKVYVNNYRLWLSSLRVRRLPTDKPELTRFLSEVEGDLRGVQYRRDRRSGLLVEAVDRRFVDAPNFKTTYEYNNLQGQKFQFSWDGSVPVVDLRDKMHKRGWTYFRIKGHLGGHRLSGRGRIPFVYSSFGKYPPWLVLKVGDELEIIDCNLAAVARRAGRVIRRYKPGSFFKGLARPWMGLHTVDIVRRDAAEQQVWFDTSITADQGRVIVTLLDNNEYPNCYLTHLINLEKDVVEEIRFKQANRNRGLVEFEYLEDISNAGQEFVEPALTGNAGSGTQQQGGIKWLFDLATGRFQ